MKLAKKKLRSHPFHMKGVSTNLVSYESKKSKSRGVLLTQLIFLPSRHLRVGCHCLRKEVGITTTTTTVNSRVTTVFKSLNFSV